MNEVIILIISWIIFLLILLPIFIFLFFLLTNEFNKIYINNIVGNGSKWYQRLFLFPFGILNYFFGRYYIRKHSSNGSQKDCIAIVRANNYFPENVFPIFSPDEKKLVKYLYKNNKNYKVFEKITLQQLRKIIMDKNFNSILIFGHGEKHGVKVGKNEVFYYCDLPKNIPKRHLVAQFHCNHHNGKGMLDYGVKAKHFFINEKKQNSFDIEKQVNEIIKKKLL